MSWAVPEVRKHVIELLREQVRFGADGANVVFNRGYPVVLYEPPPRRCFRRNTAPTREQCPSPTRGSRSGGPTL